MNTEPEKMFLKPAVKNLIVVDPSTGKPLPAEGALVAMSSYWHRRVMQGDAIETTQADQNNDAAATPAKAKTETAKA
jgi:hypothetical protein